MPAQMNALFDNLHKLPQVPEVVRTLINQLNDPKAEMLDIAKNVEKEQVIALKILRLVNSAHFGLSRKVASLDAAIVMLGMEQLKILVIASGIVSSVPSLKDFDLRKFWSNSFRTAAYAKWLAEQTDLHADIAFTAGLICNMGNLLIHMTYPGEANEIDQHVKAGHTPRPDVERKRIGFTSQDACAELCRRWKFADQLTETIQQSGEPLSYEKPSALSCVLHIAQYLSNSIDQGKQPEELIAVFPYSIAECIGLTKETIPERLEQLSAIQNNLEGLAD